MIGYGTVADEIREDECLKDNIKFYKINEKASQQEDTNIATIEPSTKEATTESFKEKSQTIVSNEAVKGINRLLNEEYINIQIDKTLDSMELSEDDEKFLEPINKIAILYANKISDKLSLDFPKQDTKSLELRRDLTSIILREFRIKARRAALIGLKSKLSQEMIAAQIIQIGDSILAR